MQKDPKLGKTSRKYVADFYSVITQVLHGILVSCKSIVNLFKYRYLQKRYYSIASK